MKKITKATLAAGAGLALLLGTGGTLAYWNSSASLGSATITAGNLALTQVGNGTWQIQHTSAAAPEPVTDIAALRLVPGDKLIYTGDYKIAAQGRNLVFKADIAPGAITAASAGTAADEKLKTRLTQSAEYTINGVKGQTATIKHKSDAAGSYDVKIAVTLTWPFDQPAGTSPAEDNPAKLGKVSLSAFAVTATQLDGTTTP